jgi:hypothetical protein
MKNDVESIKKLAEETGLKAVKIRYPGVEYPVVRSTDQLIEMVDDGVDFEIIT